MRVEARLVETPGFMDEIPSCRAGGSLLHPACDDVRGRLARAVDKGSAGSGCSMRQGWRMVRAGVAVTAFLPFLLALAVHAGRPPQPLSIIPPVRPALVFDQYLVDLGKAHPTSKVQASFVFCNRGRQAVTLTEIRPSCGCLQPLISRKSKVFEPGDLGRIVLEMQPANEAPGKREYFADIRYADPEPREVRVTFRVELPEHGIYVTPPAVLMYLPASNTEPMVQDLVVTDTRLPGARIVDAETDLSYAQVDVGETRLNGTQGLQSIVRVTVAGQVPLGKHQGVVRIRTSDPRMPQLRVPLWIESTADRPLPGDSSTPAVEPFKNAHSE